MTSQINNKNLIFFIVFSLLTGIALVYGFSLIPSPAVLQLRKFDQTRVLDLDKIKTAIQDYYYKNYKLPASLNDLSGTFTNSYAYYSTGTKYSKQDPQTQAIYEYIQTSQNSYQLCAVFGTNSEDEDAIQDQPYDYQYNNLKIQYKHTKGRTCFTQNISLNQSGGGGGGGGYGWGSYYTYPTPTPVLLNNSYPEPTMGCGGNCENSASGSSSRSNKIPNLPPPPPDVPGSSSNAL